MYQALLNFKLSSVSDISKLIEKYRTLHLINPYRVLYESGRGSSKNLNSLLEKKEPVFHVRSLGNIWAYANLKEEKTFITDSRKDTSLYCQ